MPTPLIVNPTPTSDSRLTTCAAIVAASRMALPYTLDLLLAGVRLAVGTNSPALAEALARHYAEFPGDGGEPDVAVWAIDGDSPRFDLPFALYGESGAKEEYVDLPDGRVVRKRRTGLWLVFGPAGNYVLGPCAEQPQQVVNAINARLADFELCRGARLLHAAGVATASAGLAISGFAGAGKSTLALEIMRHGADFLTNDRVLVNADASGLYLTGIARAPRVNPGTILANDRLESLLPEDERAAYAGLPKRELWGLERKYDVPIAACFGPGRVRLRARLTALVVLAWKPGGGALEAQWTTLVQRSELLPALVKDLGVLFGHGPLPADVDGYLTLLGQCPVLAVSGGVDFPRAAALCLDVLGRGA
ncbi:HprK-related kinase B [Desulfovibrio sp. TomC]|uniref:HprK-related kinase B n=1 Tax=Desulfovibrio sp. TomC TaxID=1562888 RepID=UPI00069F46E1|nr:HprK-related kinase B [Desulfovibrio sp. TomC]